LYSHVLSVFYSSFFYTNSACSVIYSLSLHDALPISKLLVNVLQPRWGLVGYDLNKNIKVFEKGYINTKAIEGISPLILLILLIPDRKSTRLNSSHVSISYAVFCLKKKNRELHSLLTG